MAAPVWLAWVGVLGTWLIAITAIWGERIRATFLKPDLQLNLVSPSGELTTQFEESLQAPSRIIPARYYHVCVRNSRHFPAAHEVQVYLTKLEVRGPDGGPQSAYTTDLPLTWRFQELYPHIRTIGHATRAEVDLFFVRTDRLQLTPMLLPTNLPATMLGETHLWMTVVARGLEGESRSLRLKIDWDGEWDRGDTEMQRHLTISVV